MIFQHQLKVGPAEWLQQCYEVPAAITELVRRGHEILEFWFPLSSEKPWSSILNLRTDGMPNSRVSHSRTAWDELLRTRKWGFCGGKPQKSKIRSVYTFSTVPKHHCCAYNCTNSVEKQEQPEKYPEMANITFQPLLLKTLTSGMLLVCESEKDAGDGL